MAGRQGRWWKAGRQGDLQGLWAGGDRAAWWDGKPGQPALGHESTSSLPPPHPPSHPTLNPGRCHPQASPQQEAAYLHALQAQHLPQLLWGERRLHRAAAPQQVHIRHRAAPAGGAAGRAVAMWGLWVLQAQLVNARQAILRAAALGAPPARTRLRPCTHRSCSTAWLQMSVLARSSADLSSTRAQSTVCLRKERER